MSPAFIIHGGILKISIRWVIILGCFILIWGTHLVMTPISLYSSQKIMEAHSRDIMENILDLSLEQTRNYFSTAKVAADLTQRLIGSDIVHMEDGQLAELEHYFLEKMQIYPQFAGIYLADPRGCFYFVNREGEQEDQLLRTKLIEIDHGQRMVHLSWRNKNMEVIRRVAAPEDTFDPRRRPWYIKASRERDIIWTEPYIFFSSRKPGITTAGPLMDPEGRLKGVVGVDIELEALSNFIGNLRVGKTGAAFMINKNQDVIAFPGRSQAFSHAHLPREDLRLPKLSELSDPVCAKAFEAAFPDLSAPAPGQPRSRVFAEFIHQDKCYFAMFTQVQAANTEWLIGVYIPEEDYLGEIQANSRRILWVTLLVSVLATLGGLFVGRKITRPISQLDHQAGQIKNDPEAPLPKIQSMFTQIQHTADTFYDMHRAVHKYKQELAHRERLHRAILDSANEAIFMVDDAGTIYYWNSAAFELFGVPAESAMGQNVFDLPAFKPSPNTWDLDLYALLTQRRTEPGIKNLRLPLTRPGGEEIPTEVSMVRVRMDDTAYTIAVVRDISLRAREEDEKLTVLSQLKQAQKMESIGTLAGGIAHDFNNILTSIVGNAELLQANMNTDEENRPYLDAITLAGDRAKELVAQILAFSHQDVRKAETLKLDTIIQDACRLMAATLPAGITLIKEINPQCSPVTGDSVQLHQVALNLLTNAVHAMADTGGTLKVGLREEELVQEGNFTTLDPGPGRYVCYRVSDTGTGIDPQVMDQIFDPYFTTKSQGTGLGLAVIKGIVEHHGGGIRVTSTPGRGTVFKVYLPRARSREVAPPGPAAPTKIVKGSEHILLVDDQHQVLNIQRQILAFLGYRISQRSSALDALEAFRADPQRFDLVITDYGMRPMNGRVLARKLKEIRPDLPIILCTGYNQDMAPVDLPDADILEVVTKPIKIKEFSAAIRRCLNAAPPADQA